MNISIVGAGAVGSMIAYFLNPHYKVTLYGRSARPLILKINNQTMATNINVIPLNDHNIQKSDIIYVTTKATQLKEVIPYVEAMCHKDSMIIICQNGFSQTDLFSHRNTYHAVVYISGQKVNNEVIYFQDNTLILPNNHQTQYLQQWMNETDLNIELSDQYHEKVWTKLLVNLGINSITALTLNTAQVLKSEGIEVFMKQLLQEGFQVAQSEGVQITSSIDDIMSIYHTYNDFMGTSMYYDRIQLQPTEYAFIQGYIQSVAQKNNVSTPLLDMVTLLLKGYQQQFYSLS